MVVKLNTIHYPSVKEINISKSFSLDSLQNNELYLDIERKLLKKFSFTSLKTFAFTKEGFLSLLCMLSIRGKIAICVGETNALVEAGKLFESLGFSIEWIGLQKDGQVDFEQIQNLDASFLFLSSYIMDTFVVTDLEKIKTLTSAMILSNATVAYSGHSDVLYFDPYKLTGFTTSGVLLCNNLFEKQTLGDIDTIGVYAILQALEGQKPTAYIKEKFRNTLQKLFGDDLYFFVEPDNTLDSTLHFALKDIKARELIRTLALDEVLITNGEGCSLGLSQPSQIIEAMGYTKELSRNGISLSFYEEIDDATIEKVCRLFYKRYRQIKVLT